MDNERVIAKSESYNVKKIGTIIIVCGCILAVLVYVFNHLTGHKSRYGGREWYDMFGLYAVTIPIIIFLLSVVVGFILSAAFGANSITVTDKRVTGKRSWGRLVELPINQISAIAMGGIKGVAVATSSGMVRFSFIKNREDIFSAVSTLLKQRQDAPAPAAPAPAQAVQNVQQSTNADEIAKYKQLLDSGAITQEEYDTKKKQLLGL